MHTVRFDHTTATGVLFSFGSIERNIRQFIFVWRIKDRKLQKLLIGKHYWDFSGFFILKENNCTFQSSIHVTFECDRLPSSVRTLTFTIINTNAIVGQARQIYCMTAEYLGKKKDRSSLSSEKFQFDPVFWQTSQLFKTLISYFTAHEHR